MMATRLWHCRFLDDNGKVVDYVPTFLVRIEQESTSDSSTLLAMSQTEHAKERVKKLIGADRWKGLIEDDKLEFDAEWIDFDEDGVVQLSD